MFGKRCSKDVRAVEDGGSDGGSVVVSNLRGRAGIGKGIELSCGESDVLRIVVRPDIEDEAGTGTGRRRSSSEDASMTIPISLTFLLSELLEGAFGPSPPLGFSIAEPV